MSDRPVYKTFKYMNKNTYLKLLDTAFSISDSFVLVMQSQFEFNDKAYALVASLEANLIQSKSQYEWPGTSSGAPAVVSYYNCNADTKKIIMNGANSLYQWMAPDYPEDLSFIINGKEWLITTAHEKMAGVVFEEENDFDIFSNIKDLFFED